ncbi:MAG: SbcC/MukB-like Walker B domain-containing protein, partial [Verrucomicrobiota bacterium]
SMKSVGNLTDFVRGHMLEPFDVESRITALIAHFDDLDRAHAAVIRAKRQVLLLEPIVADCDRHEELCSEVEELRAAREFLEPHFATLKLELLEKRAATLDSEHERQTSRIQGIAETLASLRRDEADLNRQIAENGGDRIATLTARIGELSGERDRRKTKSDRYADLVSKLDEPATRDAAAFNAQHDRIAALTAVGASDEADLENRITDDTVAMRKLQDELAIVSAEIDSLKARRSNIPSQQIAIREALCQALDLTPEDMPFVGELLQVRPEEAKWEGAAERLLHNFGLSLLVPDSHYPQVVEWVDRTHLRGRLVYFRIRSRASNETPDLHADSIVRKLQIRPDSQFYDWVERELAHRFDVVCCATSEQFRRETRAITLAGQMKMPGERHEKDDRSRIDDRSRFILGWSNEAKIATLEREKSRIESQGASVVARLAKADAERRALRERVSLLSKLEEYRDFREIDWSTVASDIAALEEERHQLENASDILRQLNEKLHVFEKAIADGSEKLTGETEKLGGIKNRIENNNSSLATTRDLLSRADTAALAAWHDRLAAIRSEALGDKAITIEGCDTREKETRDWLQARIDSRDKAITTVRDRLINRMSDFRREFEAETREIDAAVESAGEFRQLLDRLCGDDLPRFEQRFKELLNQNTIREIANFNAHLNQQRETIRERVTRINQSLIEIDYNPGRYIVLEATPVPDQDIRAFQTELRSCTEGALTGSEDDQYSEAKFLQVKAIIERFRGREGTTELDRRWTRKVSDVRNWFAFAASERWKEDHTEHEHYSDSGGKSGGQKEKLAYTILAASLAYQFGLEWGRVRSRSFRFVVIDEAFGRGSDESAQYGLRLFAKLNLQLLIVTPLQKIHIIEPHVSSVGFVHNIEGRDSQLRNLTIEQYREEKARNQS